MNHHSIQYASECFHKSIFCFGTCIERKRQVWYSIVRYILSMGIANEWLRQHNLHTNKARPGTSVIECLSRCKNAQILLPALVVYC